MDPAPQPQLGHLPACKGEGQARVNNYHHPERYLMHDENDNKNDGDDGDDDC